MRQKEGKNSKRKEVRAKCMEDILIYEERKEWTLLAIYCANEDGLSPAQLQKSLFLLGKNLPDAVGDNYYQFTPYGYGPFDQTIYFDAEQLSRDGLISINYTESRKWPKYFITSKGKEHGEKSLKQKTTKEVIAYLTAVIKWAQSLTFQELIRAIYHAFPKFKSNGVFQE